MFDETLPRCCFCVGSYRLLFTWSSSGLTEGMPRVQLHRPGEKDLPFLYTFCYTFFIHKNMKNKQAKTKKINSACPFVTMRRAKIIFLRNKS